MKKITTNRLIIREADISDAAFIFRLLNNPTWIEHIGDRNIKTLEDAEKYIQNALISSYKNNGHGMYLILEKETQKPMGLCGFLKREDLEFVDIGFAILPEFAGKGYTYEAAKEIIERSEFKSFYGITSEENIASQKLLTKLGLKFVKKFQFGNYEDESLLYLNEPNKTPKSN